MGKTWDSGRRETERRKYEWICTVSEELLIFTIVILLFMVYESLRSMFSHLISIKSNGMAVTKTS